MDMEYQPKKSKAMLAVEKKYKKTLEELLFEMYYDRNMTVQEMGEEVGVDHSTISVWMAKLRVPTRTNISKNSLVDKFRKKRG